MSLRNRRTGKIGPPPDDYDTEWLNRLRIYVEELAGRRVFPDGDAREILASNGTEWVSHNGDNYGYCDETSVDVIDED